MERRRRCLDRQRASFTARLIQLDGKKLEKLSLANAKPTPSAPSPPSRRSNSPSAESKRSRSSAIPAPPFITSTLQQEAARKLGFAAKRTMQVAQALYEGVDIGGETVGLITYMRTDGITMAGEAIAEAARRDRPEMHGARYVPTGRACTHTKAKNAQEAHEAIRPTSFARTPGEVARYLDARCSRGFTS